MLKKNYLIILCAAALFLAGNTVVFGQLAPVGGQVKLKKADGTFEPIAGAVVEVYRVDSKGSFPAAKTDKKGFFSFAGLPLGGNFVLSISAPNASPGYYPNVKPGMDKIAIALEPGDGKRWTEEDIRAALNNSAPVNSATPQKPAELTAEQKKAQAEYEKQATETTEKNKKIENSNKIIDESLKAGNEAFKAKNYDLAITKFDEGYNADPDYAGSAPVLLNNKATALLLRATANYNQAVKGDPGAKAAAMQQVKKDFDDVVNASNKSLEILKSATSTDANLQKSYGSNKFQALTNRKEGYRLMSKTGADRTRGKEALTAFQDYMTAETDPKRKSDAQLSLAEALQDSSEFDLAVTEFEKVLAVTPDNVDALAGAGFSLVNIGYINNDKSKLQQGANYLQKFADLAPDTNQYKNDAKGLIETLKKEQAVTPQKTSKGKKN